MLRFSIRDVLWLTVVVALAVGWWLELRNRGPENVKLRAENARLVSERDTANWQLESSASVLKKRGLSLTYRGYSVQVSDGKSVIGRTKKSTTERYPTQDWVIR